MVQLYSPATTPRLEYVLGVIFRDHLRVPYRLTSDRDDWMEAEGPKINYSSEKLPVGLAISPSGILSERYVPGQAPLADPLRGAGPLPGGGATAVGGVHPGGGAASGGHPGGGAAAAGGVHPGGSAAHLAGAATPDAPGWPFDLFGAVFYLLSRYEEYLPQALYDHFGRFDPAGSWAARQGWLERPLVDEWIAALAAELHLGGTPAGAAASGAGAVNGGVGRAATSAGPAGSGFFATYDIDQPWCYQNKGLTKNCLSAGKALTGGRWTQLREQAEVLSGKRRDPFDNFSWMDRVNEALPETPVYFFPLSAKRTVYDKNPSPGNGAYQELIRAHAGRYPVGVHPSFHASDTPGLLASECAVLNRITGLPVTVSRFHYIRFRLPQGYRLLLEGGIRADYSMGYGERNGFRASYSRPFPWYDLEKETTTALQVVPFCWMEATSFHNSGLSREAALAELQGYKRAVDLVGGRMTVIWHNNSLGEEARWIGWREVYKDFLKPFVPTLPS
ncbi:polysaccharide deacetylase family protein [Dinghuibacter silviterrae]|uniref:DUF7033 domain-containing protein n=1 Tax=Dinghuibacter silviterrae TaxID=1539049 RepID=A0A4R8DUR3_9BACT|nr:polysaccharide deacetylase family protein [Dinghuibacter silviterrae]TDX01658.1 hypothetical protein EDB95_2699 [Dinghuibacter silviterrae]